MKRASQLFNDEQTTLINQAVAEAESRTSAEIVPVVATASGRYDRPEDMVGLWFALALTAAAYMLVPNARETSDSWGQPSGLWKLLIMMSCIVCGFIAGAVLGARVAWMRRLCTPRGQMIDEVQSRAKSVFFDNRIGRTAGGAGLLLYVSLYERRAAIIADETIGDRIGQAALDQLRDELTAALRKGDITAAMSESIASTGQRMGEVLPRAEDDENELPNSLVTLD